MCAMKSWNVGKRLRTLDWLRPKVVFADGKPLTSTIPVKALDLLPSSPLMSVQTLHLRFFLPQALDDTSQSARDAFASALGATVALGLNPSAMVVRRDEME